MAPWREERKTEGFSQRRVCAGERRSWLRIERRNAVRSLGVE
jgi:hypothetical protein